MEKQQHTDEISPESLLITTGVLYLIIIVTGIFSELLVRDTLFDFNNVSTTIQNVASSQYLFRLGFMADSIMLICDVVVAVLLYTLLKEVNKTLALLAALFRLTEAALLGMNLLNYHTVLLLINHMDATATSSQQGELVALFMERHTYGYDLGLIFFGVSNLILGYLLVRSMRYPSIVGYGLQAAGVVYLTGSYGRFLFPEFISLLTPIYMVPLIAESSFALLLIITGIKVVR